MSYRALAAFPVAAVALATVLLLAVPDAARPGVLHVLVEAVKILALVGMGAAALVFNRGDYLRRGWGLAAACYGLLLARDAWLLAAPGPQGAVIDALRGALVVLANASVVGGMLMLARAWSVAGLDLPGSSAGRRAVVALAVTASLLFAGPSLVVDVAISLKDGTHYWTVGSDLGDLLALPLVAPVAMTALAARDGSLRWPWGLLTASLAAWLFYDAALTLPQIFHLDYGPFRLVAEECRVFAGTSACAAGLAQRKAMRELDASG